MSTSTIGMLRAIVTARVRCGQMSTGKQSMDERTKFLNKVGAASTHLNCEADHTLHTLELRNHSQPAHALVRCNVHEACVFSWNMVRGTRGFDAMDLHGYAWPAYLHAC